MAKFRVVDDWFVSGASTCWKVNGTTAVFEGTRDFFPFWSQQPTIIPGEFVFLKINAFYFGKQLIVARCPSVHHFAVMDVSSFFALAHESCAHKILHPQDIAWKCGHAKMKDLRAAHNNFRSVFFSCSTFQVPARAGIVPSTHNYGLVAYHSSTSTDTSTSNSTCSLLRFIKYNYHRPQVFFLAVLEFDRILEVWRGEYWPTY